MAVVLSIAGANAMANAIRMMFEGEGGVNGYILFTTAADAEVAKCMLAAHPFPSSVAGVIISATVEPDTSTIQGTIENCKLYTKDDVLVFTAKVGTSGADINMPSTTFANLEKLEVPSFTFTVPNSGV